MTVVSVEDQRQRVGIGRPHVVLLGAGASLAALPNGDKRGVKPPLMANFISTLGLESLLRDHGVKHIPDNFETLYSSLHGKSEYQPLLTELEQRVYEYFAAFELPDTPTLYDHLLLSLRDQDFIATFNWDPLLVQAYIRNRKVLRELPTHALSARLGCCGALPRPPGENWTGGLSVSRVPQWLRSDAAAVPGREEGVLSEPVHRSRVGGRQVGPEGRLHVHGVRVQRAEVRRRGGRVAPWRMGLELVEGVPGDGGHRREGEGGGRGNLGALLLLPPLLGPLQLLRVHAGNPSSTKRGGDVQAHHAMRVARRGPLPEAPRLPRVV
ncbi:hypothetical protein AnaeK_1545 [Anaeromyxobacter sp. K]|nr:hypothetical protein AnaeK_1545 [Anaeromyxobacter sp. K]